MAKKKSTSQVRQSLNPDRNQIEHVAASSAPDITVDSDCPLFPLLQSPLAQALRAERARLLEVHAVLKCLYEALLYADDNNAALYADVANLAAKLVDESVERLDLAGLESLVETIRHDDDDDYPLEKLDAHHYRNEVRDSGRPRYLC